MNEIKTNGVAAKELIRRKSEADHTYVIAERATSIDPYVVWHVDSTGNCSMGYYTTWLEDAVDKLIQRTNTKESKESLLALAEKEREKDG